MRKGLVFVSPEEEFSQSVQFQEGRWDLGATEGTVDQVHFKIGKITILGCPLAYCSSRKV